MSVLLQFMKKYKLMFFVAISFLSLETVADILQPFLLSKLIDEGVMTASNSRVFYWGSLMIGTAFFGLICALMRNYISTHVAFNFSRDLREKLYQIVLKLDIIQVEDFERGSLINRLTFDVNQLQMFLNGTMRVFLKAPLMAFGGLFMVMEFGRNYFLIYISVLPIAGIIFFINVKYAYPLMARIQLVLDRMNKKTIEFLNGIRVVKAFNRVDFENHEFTGITESLKKTTVTAMRFEAIFNPLVMLVINGAIAVAIYLSVGWIGQGIGSVGDTIALINYLSRLMFAVHITSRIFNMYIRAKTSNKRIEEILQVERDLDLDLLEKGGLDRSEFMGKIIPEDLHKGIHVDQVNFRFGQGQDALYGIDFRLKPGQSLGVLGTTGSGKSTLVHILTGLLEPTEGQVRIGSKILNHHNISSYRDYLGVVYQEKIIFTDTIAGNMTFGPEDAKGVKEALELAAGDFVFDMKKGINTGVGKAGVNLSGGQKQRVSIARAFYKKPSFYILDDSTSALDALTEQKLFDHLLEMQTRDKMFMVIAQKISTLRKLDRILVLRDGHMAGIGSHDELMDTCPYYKELYEIQSEGAGT